MVKFQVSKSHVRSDGCIEDFCDGTFFKDHPLYAGAHSEIDSLNLQFITYFDEVEVTNPLGSSRGHHKLG